MNTRTINIINTTGIAPEPRLMQDVLTRCEHHIAGGFKIDIVVDKRVPPDAPAHQHPGWLEYAITVYYKTCAPLRIGAIQRDPDAPTEFCS
jgi:hypothetical protein